MARGQGESRKYQAVGPQAEFEPGSRGRVLRNLLGVTHVGIDIGDVPRLMFSDTINSNEHR